jgi:dihydrofolate reductase
MLYHIVAMAENRVIGKNNRLPWHFSSDLKHFKQTTMGGTLIMGRKTFESIGKKPLPGRENFVLSRTTQNPENGVRFFAMLEDALGAASNNKIFVMGGQALFKETMKQMDGIYLTKIHEKYEGDIFYPEIPDNFQEQSRKTLQENPKIEAIYYEKK